MRRTPEKSSRSSLGGGQPEFEGVEGCDDGFAAGMGLTKGNYEISRRTALRRYSVTFGF